MKIFYYAEQYGTFQKPKTTDMTLAMKHKLEDGIRW